MEHGKTSNVIILLWEIFHVFAAGVSSDFLSFHPILNSVFSQSNALLRLSHSTSRSFMYCCNCLCCISLELTCRSNFISLPVILLAQFWPSFYRLFYFKLSFQFCEPVLNHCVQINHIIYFAV